MGVKVQGGAFALGYLCLHPLAFNEAPLDPGCSWDALIKVAATEAFWTLDKTSMNKLAKYLHLDVPPGSSVFQTVFSMVQGVLTTLTDQEVVDICRKRLARMSNPSSWSEELANVDEAMACLDKHDEKDIKREQEAQKRDLETKEVFSKDFKEKRRALKEAAEAWAHQQQNTLHNECGHMQACCNTC